MPDVKLLSVPEAFENRKIQSIKEYRAASGLGLKEAKAVVDSMDDGSPIVCLSEVAIFDLLESGWMIEHDVEFDEVMMSLQRTIRDLRKEVQSRDFRINDLQAEIDRNDRQWEIDDAYRQRDSMRSERDEATRRGHAMDEKIQDALRAISIVRNDAAATVGDLWFALADVDRALSQSFDDYELPDLFN